MSYNDIFMQDSEFHEIQRSNLEERPRRSKVRPRDIHMCVLMVLIVFGHVAYNCFGDIDVEVPLLVDVHIYVGNILVRLPKGPAKGP